MIGYRPLFSVFLPSASSSLSTLPRLHHRLRLNRRLACVTMEGGGGEGERYQFGPYKIDPREVFYSTSLSYAMVNLRPLLPGTLSLLPLYLYHIAMDLYFANDDKYVVYVHLNKVVHVLVCPRREVKRFIDLTPDETSNLWITAQKVGAKLEQFHNASSLTLAIQDGPQAGQTVPHVHIHVIPRKSGDFEKNDEIYDAMDVKEKELKEKLDLDIERKDRTLDEMACEADTYRSLFS
ncbi:Bis(5'-adenosyl)-triphosphatase [Rhynchospora pubera]|uniref:Bis(5'-adenosyl)-triphosphatase n=1 Tax=Rhynchospora pubera TaxID=906938 RepID=A0AAV8DVJ7_9POAL|nr:Bis(5'-adenosyl)-triphosphatase [Rhynchospora pubera]